MLAQEIIKVLAALTAMFLVGLGAFTLVRPTEKQNVTNLEIFKVLKLKTASMSIILIALGIAIFVALVTKGATETIKTTYRAVMFTNSTGATLITNVPVTEEVASGRTHSQP